MSDMVSATIELEKMAMNGLPPPKELSLAGKKFYLSMVDLYRLFRSGVYNRDQAHDIKLDLVKDYQNELFREKLTDHHADIRNRYSHLLIQAEKEGCPVCRELVKIFDGRVK